MMWPRQLEVSYAIDGWHGHKRKDKVVMTVGDETGLVRRFLAGYCTGRGADLGCGRAKIVPAAIGVELNFYGNRRQSTLHSGENYFNHDLNNGCPMFRDNELDYVYSSHVLEDFVDPEVKLTEWTRITKPNGWLILVLPHEDYYPKAGTPEANPHHKRDWSQSVLIDMVTALGLPLRVHEVFTPERFAELGQGTVSFAVVFQKTESQE